MLNKFLCICSIENIIYIYRTIMAKILNSQANNETIRIKGNKIIIKIMVWSGKDGEYFVNVSPTLLVSGYGSTEKEARDSFNHNLDVFCNDLIALSTERKSNLLYSLGFKKEKFRTKNFSNIFSDKNNFIDELEPNSIKSQMLELAY